MRKIDSDKILLVKDRTLAPEGALECPIWANASGMVGCGILIGYFFISFSMASTISPYDSLAFSVRSFKRLKFS
jgi:hypothetical protein